jgi:hypothetical protein
MQADITRKNFILVFICHFDDLIGSWVSCSLAFLAVDQGTLGSQSSKLADFASHNVATPKSASFRTLHDLRLATLGRAD